MYAGGLQSARRLLDGGAGASGGTNNIDGINASNQLSISDTAIDVASAAQLNSASATKLATDGGVANAQWAQQTATTPGVFDSGRKLLDGGAGASGGTNNIDGINASNQLSISDTAIDVASAAQLNSASATKLATDGGVANAQLAQQTATTPGVFDSGRKLLDGGAGVSGGTNNIDGINASNQLSISDTAIDVASAAQLNSASATKLATDGGVANAQLAQQTATTPGMYDSGRKLLDGGAGASGGTNNIDGINASNQLSISDTAIDVASAAQLNSASATKLATDGGIANAQLAQQTATTPGMFDSGRKLL
eukprot:jgi/Chrzof1/9624/Cz04g10030.t1